MKQLEKVQNNTTWAKASNAINNNNDALYVAVTTLEHAAFKNKGYFKSIALLYGAYPTAENGAQAFVYNSSNPTSAPYDIYEWVNGAWQDTGVNGGNVNVNLDSKQDTLVGYSESVSGGKATQVAIQGDTIALSGKVSLGNVDDMESAILMSSSQAGAAVAKANTVEQSMSALKSPVKPIHLNSQGKLELSIGKGLYVEDGKLCTTGASGGGGGGTTLSEGDGIRIYNDTINVEYDIYTLRVNSCGGLTVNYGEGLTIKNGKLSAQASVNAGNGLVQKGDELSVNISTGLQYGSDGELAVKTGKGLSVDNTGTINANIDNSTIATNSDGAMYVQKGMLAGQGLKVSLDRLAVNYGNGLTISNKALVIDYGAGLDIQDGKLVSTVQGGKTYVGGQAVNITGNEINVKYDGVTISTKDTTDKSLHVMLGSGLKQGSNGIDVAVGSGLAIGSDNKLYSTVSSGKTYTAGDGIGINGNKIAVLYGSGLTTNSCGGLKVDVGSLVSGGRGLLYNNDGTMGVNVGRGLKIESCQVVVDEAVMTEVGKISGKQDRLSVSNGLKLANSVLKLRLSTSCSDINTSGLWYDDHGGLMVAVGTGLGIDSKNDGRLYIRCGPGITCNTDNDLTISYGSGLDVHDGKVVLHEDIYDRLDSAEGGIGRCRDAITNLQTEVGGKQNALTLATGLEWGKANMIQVKMNAPLSHDDCGRLQLNYDCSLTVANSKLGVSLYGINDPEGGLTVNNNGLAVNAGAGLKVDTCQVVVNYGTGLSVNNNKIYVDTSKIAGEGVDIDSDYKKLTIGTKAAKTLAGSGLKQVGSQLAVDAANLTVGKADEANSTLRFKVIVDASTTIDCNTYKEGIMYNYNAVNLWKNAPSGMSYGQVLNLRNTFAAPDLLGQLAWDVNHGSTTDTTRNLWWRASDDGTLTEAKWHQIAFRDAVPLVTTLFQRGDYQYFVVLLCKYGTNLTNTFHRLSGKIYSEGHGAGRYVAADVDIFVSDWSSGMDKNLRFDTYGINEMDLVTCNYGGVKYLAIRNYGIQAKNLYFAGTSTNMLLTPIHYYTVNTGTVHNTEINGSIAKVTVSQPLSNGNKYALVTDTVARATADANGNNIAETYLRSVDFGEGLASGSHNGQLQIPRLTSTLAGNAVDGSKNGAQRVLNLSCGAIQIKLSTGLAIDDNGYLYIQDKYVTK